jgi:putative DNA primase/helicase
MGIAYAVAVGGHFLKWHAPQPRNVLYIDGEMPAAAMQERLRRISLSEDLRPPEPDYLRLITPDLQDGPMPDLSTLEGRVILKELIGDSELIIIDNLSSLFRSGVENEAESWQPVQDWALEMRRNGKTIIFVHHAAKGGQQRGTSKKEDILDTVIVLKQPQGYRSDQGAYFEVNFEKTRHFAGSDAASFNVQLKEQLDGLWEWDISQLNNDDAEIIAVAEAIHEGLTIEQIMKRTGLSKSQVETRKKKAKMHGLINE